MPLAQRVVIAQVAGLRELCEHTSDTVRFNHVFCCVVRRSLTCCVYRASQWQLEEKVFGNSTVLNVHEKTDDNDSFYEPASEGSDDEGYAIELDPAHRNADAEDCALLSGELGSSGVAGFSENGGNAQIGKNAPEVGNLEKVCRYFLTHAIGRVRVQILTNKPAPPFLRVGKMATGSWCEVHELLV